MIINQVGGGSGKNKPLIVLPSDGAVSWNISSKNYYHFFPYISIKGITAGSRVSKYVRQVGINPSWDDSDYSSDTYSFVPNKMYRDSQIEVDQTNLYFSSSSYDDYNFIYEDTDDYTLYTTLRKGNSLCYGRVGKSILNLYYATSAFGSNVYLANESSISIDLITNYDGSIKLTGLIVGCVGTYATSRSIVESDLATIQIDNTGAIESLSLPSGLQFSASTSSSNNRLLEVGKMYITSIEFL